VQVSRRIVHGSEPPLKGVSPINATPNPAGNFELFEKINFTTLLGNRSAGADCSSGNQSVEELLR